MDKEFHGDWNCSQEVFDHLVIRMLEQGRRSLIDPTAFHEDVRRMAGGCAYRGMDGCRCVAGWMIPDDYYNPRDEGYPARSVQYLQNKINDKHVLELIEDLQYVHDSIKSDEFFTNEFLLGAINVAAKHGLRVPPLPQKS